MYELVYWMVWGALWYIIKNNMIALCIVLSMCVYLILLSSRVRSMKILADLIVEFPFCVRVLSKPPVPESQCRERKYEATNTHIHVPLKLLALTFTRRNPTNAPPWIRWHHTLPHSLTE